MRYIDLPSREDAHALFEDYMDNLSFRFGNIMHPPTVQNTIGEVYAQLRQGHRVDHGSAALILSVCATSAFYWDPDGSALFNFSSEEHATAQSHAWRAAAWDVLDQGQRSASLSLDAVQARLVLADILFDLEGTTARFRYNHSCAKATAYELGLHIVDLPGSRTSEDAFTKELKRRIWWSVTGTEWQVHLSAAWSLSWDIMLLVECNALGIKSYPVSSNSMDTACLLRAIGGSGLRSGQPNAVLSISTG